MIPPLQSEISNRICDICTQSVALGPENITPVVSPSRINTRAKPQQEDKLVSFVGREIVATPGYCVEMNPKTGCLDRGIGVISEVF